MLVSYRSSVFGIQTDFRNINTNIQVLDITSLVDGMMNVAEEEIGYENVLSSIIEINQYLTESVEYISYSSRLLLDMILAMAG